MGTTKNQAITERPVIEQKWEIPLLISRVMLTHPLPLVESCLRILSLTVEPLPVLALGSARPPDLHFIAVVLHWIPSH